MEQLGNLGDESSLKRRGQELFFGFNMHQDLCDLWDLLQDSILHIVRDVVSLTHGQRSFDDDVEVNVVAKADLADVAFLQADDPGSGGGNGAHLLFQLGGRRGVE